MPPTTAARIASAGRRIFEQEGAAAVTMRRVAGAVGLTPMAIYKHYANREALLDRIADAAFDELAAHWARLPARRDPRATIEALLDAYCDFALAHPRMFDFLFSERRSGARRFPSDFRARRSPTANLLADAVASGMAAGGMRTDDAWEVALDLWAHAHGLIALYRAGRVELSPRPFRALYRRSLRRLFDGLAA